MIFENAKLSISSLVSNKMRTFLSLLGIVIGISSVMIIANLGNGMKYEVEAIFDQMGTETIYLLSQGYDEAYTYDFGEQIVRDLPYINKATSLASTSGLVRAGEKSGNFGIIGVLKDYGEMTKLEYAQGESFTDEDNYTQRSVAVLGSKVAKDLFPHGDAVGQTIKIYSKGIWNFEVVGVLKQNDFNLNNANQSIMIPQKTFDSKIAVISNYAEAYVLTTPENVSVSFAAKEVKKYIDTFFGNDQKGYVIDLASIAEDQMQMMDIINMVLAGIAAISLLVGGIGIMNIMLVSVTERIKEIGIRKALGATPNAILGQFLIESVMLTLFGGVLGVILGFWGSSAFSKLLAMAFYPNYSFILIAVVFSVSIGMFFGIYPAWRAAKLDPIEALNQE